MDSKGVMEQIREHLESGKSAGQVIGLGYAPSTVYKVQRQLRQDKKRKPGLPSNGASVATTLRQGSDAAGRIAELEQQVESLQAALEEANDHWTVLEQEREQHLAEIERLQRRIQELEAEGQAMAELRSRASSLETELAKANRSAAHWKAVGQDEYRNRENLKAQLAQEREARLRSERQAQIHYDRAENLMQERDQWRQEAQRVYAQLQVLEPLKVWQGHPCVVCKKPMHGAVSREDAARLLQDFGHRECLAKRGFGLGKALLAGGVLYGLFRLRNP